MTAIEEQLRQTAAELLEQRKADVVVGFAKGTLPMSATPCFITKPESAHRLVWNSYCSNNLAVYLPTLFAPDPRLKEPPPPPQVAIIAKGCDGRSAVELIKERQALKENLIIIAAPCEGMLDPSIARRLLGGNEILEATEIDSTVTLKDETGKEVKFDREKLLAEGCRFCMHKAAPVCDIAVGEPAQGECVPGTDDRFEEFSKKPAEERWEIFCREVSKCVLCKACRSACPGCYCKVCFADQTRPKWMGAGNELRDVIFYHLVRMFHQAGRCVDCGACVRACTMGVDLRRFTYKLVQDAKELFDCTPGIDLDQGPALTEFSPHDPEHFITEPE